MTPQFQLLEALPVAVYVTDAEGRITFFNQAAVELWGHAPEPGARWCGSWKTTRLKASRCRTSNAPWR